MRERLAAEGADQRRDGTVEIRTRRFARQPQHRNSLVLVRWVDERIGKIEIERHQRASVSHATCEQCMVRRGLQPLRRDRADVMSGVLQRPAAQFAEILIQLQFHARASRGISTNRSRAISEP